MGKMWEIGAVGLLGFRSYYILSSKRKDLFCLGSSSAKKEH
jgi:hypothetical protein